MSLWSWFDKAFDVGAAMQDATPLRLVKPIEAPSRDEFAAWRDDPTTQFVMAALRRNADECRDEWLRQSWESGNADQRALDGLRERSDALLGFTADYEAFCVTLGLQPEQEELAA
jgi:hypothetical protein